MVQKDMNKFHVPWIYYHSHDYLAIVVRTPLLEIFANQKMSKHRVENSFAGILTYQILTINDEVCIPSLSSILLAVTILNLLLKGWSRFPCFFLGLSSILLAVTILSFLQKGSSRCLCFFLEKATNHTACRAKWKLIIIFFQAYKELGLLLIVVGVVGLTFFVLFLCYLFQHRNKNGECKANNSDHNQEKS